MKQKTSTYKPKCREGNANPHWKTPHEELLKKANVQKFNGNFEVKTLKNGRIIVEPRK